MPHALCHGCNKTLPVASVVSEDWRCPKCQFQAWRNIQVVEPDRPYKLSENDRIFLRVQGILPDV